MNTSPVTEAARAGGYGWVPDLPDRRDHVFSAVRPGTAPIALPKSVDLRPGCSPVEDQGGLGSCTAHAIAGAIEFLEKKDKLPFSPISRLFVYYNERVLEDSVGSDAGASLRDGIKTLVKQGACSERRWPYVISRFAARPGRTCYLEAATHRATSYARLSTLADMKACLAAGFPFVFGFTVYESFESDAVAKSGIVPMPGPDEQVLGGHAVLGVGYDDATSRLLVRNSWGIHWGQAGYFTMPYTYASDRSLSDDFWTVRREAGF